VRPFAQNYLKKIDLPRRIPSPVKIKTRTRYDDRQGGGVGSSAVYLIRGNEITNKLVIVDFNDRCVANSGNAKCSKLINS
jgi:hypothetical protein